VDSLRVLQVHNAYREPGGEDAVVAAEARVLRAAGHTVHTFQVENPDGLVRTSIRLAGAAWNPVAAKSVRRVVEAIGPDVVHVHNTWWSLSGAVVAGLDRLEVPTVVTAHNYRIVCPNGMLFRGGRPCTDCVGSHPWHAVRHRCYRGSVALSAVSAASVALHGSLRTWARADVIATLTRFAADVLADGGIPEERLVVKPNFVDDPGLRPQKPSQSDILLYVGRLSVEKGLDVMLDAFRNSDLGATSLVIVGDGPLLPALEALELPKVRLLGRASPRKVADLMRTARALVFPSLLYEGQPMVLLEALAAGLPIVVGNQGGLPETVSKDAAKTFATGDAVSLTQALQGLTDDWVDNAGAAARRVYEERYTPEVGLGRLLEVYREAIRRRRGR